MTKLNQNNQKMCDYVLISCNPPAVQLLVSRLEMMLIDG